MRLPTAAPHRRAPCGIKFFFEQTGRDTTRLATVTTIAREARIDDAWVVAPGQFEAIASPTLFLVGSESPADIVEITRRCAATISDGQVDPLAAHGHFAYRTHPAEVADATTCFAMHVE